MAKKNNFFVVWEGKNPGIYRSWDECKLQVHGYEGALYKSFATEAEAKEALLSPPWDYIGKNAKKKTTLPDKNKTVELPDFESLSVDAACSGNPGLMEYRGVYTRTGEEIFHVGPYRDGTNNIGEFLALVHGLAFLKKQNNPLPIYSDSKTAIAWVRNRKAKTKLEKTAVNAELFDLVMRAEKWLAENTFTTSILKWETESWGEIPADFGRK